MLWEEYGWGRVSRGLWEGMDFATSWGQIVWGGVDHWVAGFLSELK